MFQRPKRIVIGIASALVLAGCSASAQVTHTARSAIEQRLLVQALYRSLRKLEVQPLQAKSASVEFYGLRADKDFAKELTIAWLQQRNINVVGEVQSSPRKEGKKAGTMAVARSARRGLYFERPSVASLDLQMVFDPANAADLHSQLLGPALLFRRFDDAVEGNDAVGGINVHAGQIGRFIRRQLRFHRSGNRAVIDVLPGRLSGQGLASGHRQQHGQADRAK
jgi:ABC-type glycerol-3-phosphate transport system substrate-binding protein